MCNFLLPLNDALIFMFCCHFPEVLRKGLDARRQMAEPVEKPEVFIEYPLPSHASSLLEKLHHQWIGCSFCDLLLIVQGQVIQVHSCVMCAFCPSLADILLQKTCTEQYLYNVSDEGKEINGECKSPSFSLSASCKNGTVMHRVALDFSCEVVECVVSAIYTGVLRPKANSITELLEAAQWLGAEGLVSAIKEIPFKLAGSDISQSITQHNKDQANLIWNKNDAMNNNLDSPKSNIILKQISQEKADKSLEKQVLQDNERMERVTERLSLDNVLPDARVSSESVTGSTTVDQDTLNTLLYSKEDESCIVQFEECKPTDAKEGSKSTAESCEAGGLHTELRKREKLLKVCDKLSTGKVEYCKYARGESSAKDCRCLGKTCSSRRMVVKLKREIIELKQTCQKKKSENSGKPAENINTSRRPRKKSSGLKAGKIKAAATKIVSPTGKKRRKRTKRECSASIKDSLIEEVEEFDPVKEELDFLMGSSTHMKCRRCNEKFTSLDLYQGHINNHPSFRCEECGMEFLRKFNLTRHVRYNHEGATHLTCRLCGSEEKGSKTTVFKAKTETEFRRHALEVHKIKEPFTCPHEGCSFRSWKYDRVIRHQQIHSEEKMFVCNKCGQGFAQHCGLVSHQRACYQLQEYLCDLCGQSFNHAQSMQSHRRVVHFGEKRFKCTVCLNSFSDHRNLRRHMRIHDNSFPYACPVCSQKYRHSNSLKSHIATKHSDLPPEQLRIPNPQPRNVLGGSSFKRRVKYSSSSGPLSKQSAAAANLDYVQSGSRGARDRKSLKAKGGDAGGEQDKGHQEEQSKLCKHQQLQQPQLLCREPTTVDVLLSEAEHQSGFEVSTNNLDIAMDPQATLGSTLRLPEFKVSGNVDQGEMAMQTAKGQNAGTSAVQEELSDSVKDYTAFLEKQAFLHSVHPSMAHTSHGPGAGTSTSKVGHTDSHLLTNQYHAAFSTSQVLQSTGVSSIMPVCASVCEGRSDNLYNDNPLVGSAHSVPARDIIKREWRAKCPKINVSNYHHHGMSSMFDECDSGAAVPYLSPIGSFSGPSLHALTAGTSVNQNIGPDHGPSYHNTPRKGYQPQYSVAPWSFLAKSGQSEDQKNNVGTTSSPLFKVFVSDGNLRGVTAEERSSGALLLDTSIHGSSTTVPEDLRLGQLATHQYVQHSQQQQQRYNQHLYLQEEAANLSKTTEAENKFASVGLRDSLPPHNTSTQAGTAHEESGGGTNICRARKTPSPGNSVLLSTPAFCLTSIGNSPMRQAALETPQQGIHSPVLGHTTADTNKSDKRSSKNSTEAGLVNQQQSLKSGQSSLFRLCFSKTPTQQQYALQQQQQQQHHHHHQQQPAAMSDLSHTPTGLPATSDTFMSMTLNGH
ncbi:Zinc finger protein [Plakobranchus ocellatus]|uniref:Zinc finger protein n=1 Tax=Plakobranchus ocellatus TaxID=259542 RepID=A0AAV4CER0_9GAST|nr:Zinc finger protein [Plakobranchus ocellatus]